MNCDEHTVPKNPSEQWSAEDYWSYLQSLQDGAHSVEVISLADGRFTFRVWNEDHGLACD